MNNKHLTYITLIASALFLLPSVVNAGGTVAGTNITNLATLSYSAGGVAQAVLESSPLGNSTSGVGNGVNTTFKVDKKVNFTVAEVDGAAVAALPGSTGNVLTFTITNTGNATEDFVLTTTAVATSSNAAFGGNLDALDVGVVATFADANGNGTYESAIDTATFVDDLSIDANTHVFIVSGTVPTTALNTQVSSYHLLATAYTGGAVGQGVIEVETVAGIETLAVEDVLFAVGQGTDTVNDSLTDGIHSAQSDFVVSSAEVTITKSALVINDPVNGIINPQAIPGATVEYTLDIVNAITASQPATLTTITDAIHADLTVVAVASSFVGHNIGWLLTDGTNSVSGTLLADGITTDGLDFGITQLGEVTYDTTVLLTSANVATATPAGLPVRVNSGDLQAGETLSLTFQVTIK